MEIALIIVGGLTLMTFVAAGFDFLTKRRVRMEDETRQKVAELESQVADLKKRVESQSEQITSLDGDVTFVHRLLDKK